MNKQTNFKTLGSSESPHQTHKHLRSFCDQRWKQRPEFRASPPLECLQSSRLGSPAECILCIKRIRLREFPLIMSKALYKKYCNFTEAFHIRPIDKMLAGGRTAEAVRFREVRLFCSEEQFFKRFYLAGEFGGKFRNLWKFHQFGAHEPRVSCPRRTRAIAEHFHSEHRRLQERGIRRMLDVLSDSQLEASDIDLGKFIAIKEEVIENKGLKSSRPVLEDLRFSIDEQNFSAKLTKHLERAKLAPKTQLAGKRTQESAKKSEPNALKLPDDKKQRSPALLKDGQGSSKKPNALHSFELLSEFSKDFSQLDKIKVQEPSYSLFEIANAFENSPARIACYSNSQPKSPDFDLDSYFEITEHWEPLVDPGAKKKRLLQSPEKTKSFAKWPAPKATPKLFKKQSESNFGEIRTTEEAGNAFKKAQKTPSRDLITKPLFQQLKCEKVPKNEPASSKGQLRQKHPVLDSEPTRILNPNLKLSGNNKSQLKPKTSISSKELTSNLMPNAKPKATPSKNDQFKIADFHKKTAEVLQSFQQQKEYEKFSDLIQEKNSKGIFHAKSINQNFLRKTHEIFAANEILPPFGKSSVNFAVQTERTATRLGSSRVLQLKPPKNLGEFRSFEALTNIPSNRRPSKNCGSIPEDEFFEAKGEFAQKKEKAQERDFVLSQRKKASVSPELSKFKSTLRNTAEGQVALKAPESFRPSQISQTHRASKEKTRHPLNPFVKIKSKLSNDPQKNAQGQRKQLKNDSQQSLSCSQEKSLKKSVPFNSSLKNLRPQGQVKNLPAIDTQNLSFLRGSQALVASCTTRNRQVPEQDGKKLFPGFAGTAKSNGSLRDCRPDTSKTRGPKFRGKAFALEPKFNPIKKIEVKNFLCEKDYIKSLQISGPNPYQNEIEFAPSNQNIYGINPFYKTSEQKSDSEPDSIRPKPNFSNPPKFEGFSPRTKETTVHFVNFGQSQGKFKIYQSPRDLKSLSQRESKPFSFQNASLKKTKFENLNEQKEKNRVNNAVENRGIKTSGSNVTKKPWQAVYGKLKKVASGSRNEKLAAKISTPQKQIY